MEVKKCARCGSFFVSGQEVCSHCQTKDHGEMFRLKNYIEENDISGYSMEQLSIQTEISPKNLNRYLTEGGFSELTKKINSNNC